MLPKALAVYFFMARSQHGVNKWLLYVLTDESIQMPHIPLVMIHKGKQNTVPKSQHSGGRYRVPLRESTNYQYKDVVQRKINEPCFVLFFRVSFKSMKPLLTKGVLVAGLLLLD